MREPDRQQSKIRFAVNMPQMHCERRSMRNVRYRKFVRKFLDSSSSSSPPNSNSASPMAGIGNRNRTDLNPLLPPPPPPVLVNRRRFYPSIYSPNDFKCIDSDDWDTAAEGHLIVDDSLATTATPTSFDLETTATEMTSFDNSERLYSDQPVTDNRHRNILNRSPSYHGQVSEDQNGIERRLIRSTPCSPHDRQPNSFEIVGSAESLVGRVLAQQGLGKYCDPDFIRYTSLEMQEALEMTSEEMDLAAHQLLQQETFINSSDKANFEKHQSTRL